VEMEKRQKVLLVVLGVLVLGMGGVYWFAIRESDTGSRNRGDAPAAVVRTRDTKDRTSKIQKRTTRDQRGRKSNKQVLEKRTRDGEERKSMDKKKRKGRKKGGEKKKKMTPAA
jgi:uncharacterized protein HemX